MRSGVLRLCGLLRVAALVAFGLGVASAAVAAPSTKIGTATLFSPSTVISYYGTASTATNSIGSSGRPAEIVELARALKNDPDLIYEYVRNNAETVWTFGLTKGALGVVVDRSGTAFDQANLLAELLRQAGFTASYKVGSITLTGTQFADWSGITSATAACQLLASGGIGAVINGSTLGNCAYGSATITSIELSHIVVSVVIGGQSYLFDPAYKPHTFKAGTNLATAAGMTSGQALTTATTGMVSGTDLTVPYVKSLAGTSLETSLKTLADTMQTAIQTSYAAGTVEDLAGGQFITPQTIPVGGLRQTTLPYTFTLTHTMSNNLPDQYRTQMTVQLTKVRPDTSTPTIINKVLYVDEIYGRRLVFDPNFDTTGASFTGALKLLDDLGGGPTLASSPGYADAPTFSKGTLTLTINMPYAAAANVGTTTAGDYMDTTFSRPVSFALPFIIAHGWGDTGRGLIDKWGLRKDTPLPAAATACEGCFPNYKATKGDARREQIAASWLAQSVRAAKLNASIAKSIYAQHYSVGVVAADTTVLATGGSPNAYAIADSFDRVDVETGFSLTSKTATAADRRAAVHTIAAVMDVLKGGAAAQVADLPDISATATRFAWGNTPPTLEDLVGGGGSRRVYQYSTTAQAGQAPNQVKVETKATTTDDGVHTGGEPEIGSSETTTRKAALASAISSYVTAGFSVVASEEAFLGPGQRGGAYTQVSAGNYSHAATKQRGGAMVATRYDANGDPIEIARVAVGADLNAVGGGAGAQVYLQAQYDPAKPADAVKGRFIDGRYAGITQTSPVSLTSGVGKFPFALSAGLFWRGGDANDETFGAISHTGPQTGWSSTWTNSLTVSGSGLEAMGVTDVRAAAGALVAFAAMQDVYKATASTQRDLTAELIGAWWAKQLVGNVAMVSVGGDARQFLMKYAGQGAMGVFAAGPGPRAEIAGWGRTIVAQHPSCYAGAITYAPTRGFAPVAAVTAVTRAANDQQVFSPWQNDLVDPAVSGSCARQGGWRMTSWQFQHQSTYTLTLSYAAPAAGAVEQLSQVVNLLGWKLVFTNGGLGGVSNGLTGGDLRSVTVAQPNGTTVTHADPSGATTKFEFSTAGQGGSQRPQLDKVYLADNSSTPAQQYLYDSLARVKETKDELSYLGTRAATQLFNADDLRTETVDALGNRRIGYLDLNGHAVRSIDPLGAASVASYDGRGRVISATAPEGDGSQLEYDGSNSVTKTTKLPKPGSAEVGQTIVTEAAYTTTSGWYTPLWTKDAKGAQTDYVYTYGDLIKVTLPAPTTGAVRPESEILQTSSYGLPTSAEDWWGNASQATYNANGTLATTVIGSATTAYTNNALGLPISINGPRTDVTDVWTVTYDLLGRPVLVVEPIVGAGPAVAKRTTYDVVGRVVSVEQGSYASSTFTPLQTTSYLYDAVGNKLRETTLAGVTQYSYDALNRVVCTAVRMNPAVYGSLPTDACTPSTTGTYGPDRITRNSYDAKGQLTKVEQGVGSTLVQDYLRMTYSPNGQKTGLTDANGNTSAFGYDGFGRLVKLSFPSPTRGSGVASTTDYEAYTYDVNGNRTSLRKRDGRVIAYQYDALNHLTVKDIPGGTAEDVYYTRDTGGRVTKAAFGSVGGAVNVQYAYDARGHVVSEGDYSNQVISQYDLAGNRTKVSQAFSTIEQRFDLYTYDAAGRLTKIETGGDPNNPTLLATFTYGSLNRRATLVRPNGTQTSYTYDTVGRLSALTHTGPGGATGSSQTFSYNPASQALTQAQATGAYLWSGQPTTTKNATHDGLNRDAAIVTASGYDANGNLISDGVRTFTYDVENRLTGVTGAAAPLAVAYDPMGRIRQVSADDVVTPFFYDGDRLIAEGGNFVSPQRRYVHGPGVDEPLVWLEGTPGPVVTTWLHADRQGSIVATSDASGVMTPYTYGPYGEPQSWSGSRFRYTGQIALPEAQLYHYKARVYDPIAGRFLQTDPIGYDDGPNIYAYVHGDPVNGADPSGECHGVTNGDTCNSVDNFFGNVFSFLGNLFSGGHPMVGGDRIGQGDGNGNSVFQDIIVTAPSRSRSPSPYVPIPTTAWGPGGVVPQNGIHMPTAAEARCFAWQAGDALGKVGKWGTIGSLGAQGVGWGTVGVGAVTLQPEVVVGGGVIVMTGEAGAGFFSTVGTVGTAIKALTGDAASAGAGANSAMAENRLKAMGAPEQVGQMGGLGVDELQDRLGIEGSPCGHGK